MSLLTLVRHGQASFAAEDYDVLSELGQRQAQLLGEHWVRRQQRFDEIQTGPRRRHWQTAELVAACYRRAGMPLPSIVENRAVDEYDLHGLVHHVAPKFARCDDDFAALVERYRVTVDGVDKARNFQRMFERLLAHWVGLEKAPDGVESWATFRQRVASALRAIQRTTGTGRRIAVFTSGGFIGAAVGWSLDVTAATAVELSYRIRNGSLTDFVFTPDRLTLDTFNAVPHLEESRMLTYR